MAENIETPDLFKIIKTPSLPTKGQLGMKEALGLSEPFMQEKARLLPKITQAKGAVEEAKQAQKVTGLAGEEQAVKQFATEEKSAQDAYQAKIEKEPLPAFIPSKENAKDIAGLFSMVSVMGALLGGTGKLNSMQALNAMNGMLEGHQKGRADLYKKQATEFDKAFKGMLQKHSEFRKEMEDAIRLAATNKEAGVAAARLAAAKAGSPVVKKMLDQDRLVDAYNLVDQSQTLAENAFKAEAKLRSEAAKEAALERRHREDREAAERRHQQDMAQRKELAQLRSEGKTTKGSQTQQQFENITSADIGNAYFRINEYLSTSKNGKIPEGSKFLRDKGTQSGIIDAYKNYLVNATLPADLQENDAKLLGIAFDVVAARAFGRASGATDTKIAQVVRQLPVEGDAESTKQSKIRILLNQLEEPNKLLPEEKKKDGASYMKSPVARNLYRTYAEKLDTGEMKETEGLEDTSSGETSYMNQSEIDEERKNAKAALSKGAPENLVKERFRKTTGQEL
jgi:hypothetical protein